MPDQNTFDSQPLLTALGSLDEADPTSETKTQNAAAVVHRTTTDLIKAARLMATKEELRRVQRLNQAIKNADQEAFRMLSFSHRKYTDAKAEALSVMRRMARDAQHRESQLPTRSGGRLGTQRPGVKYGL